MTFSPIEADNKVIILPLKNGFDIDWNFLRTIEKFKDAKLEPISDEKRKDFKFDVEEYKDAVVMPWYRNQVKKIFFFQSLSKRNPHYSLSLFFSTVSTNVG